MSLRQWATDGWLKCHRTSREEIQRLLVMVRRDLTDAAGPISADWRFGIGYNASLRLCTILLYAEGYRPAHGLQHYRTIAAMPEILGEARRADGEYLETCRVKRNVLEYDRAGVVSEAEVREIVEFAAELENDVRAWLRAKHPELA